MAPEGSGGVVNRPITASSYADASRRPRRTPGGVARLAARLGIEPRTVRQLARQLELDLHWLDVASRSDVVTGQPADWDGCIVLGLDPITGEASPVGDVT